MRIPLPSELSWQIVPLQQTRFHRIDSTRCHRFCCTKEFCVKHFLSFSAPAPLNDSYPLLASRATQWLDVFLKDQPHLINNREVPSWKLMSKGERGIHQSLSLQKRCTLQEERMLHVSKRGETWLVFSLVVLSFLTLPTPNIQCQIQGERKFFKGSQLFLLGTCLLQRSIHLVILHSTCHPNLGFLLILCLFFKKLSCVI